ncbi:hypothetical protein Tco_0543564 [Tanacetum coccineum]
MDDPDITMEEYVQLETERALRNGKVYNWETITYGKIWYDEDVHYLRFFEEEFPAIVYNDALASKSDFSSEPMEMDDPDITMEEYVQLETERALRNGKVYNWETITYGKIWYDEDVYYLRFFEEEFPAIVYNDALASKSDFSSEPMVSLQHVDEVNLKNETL